MGTRPAVALRAQRPRWRAYLLLARVSNLPTVWTNVVAGLVAAGGGLNDTLLLVRIAVASSCFYTGGMFLNDAFDADHDARHRPERPIPTGDVSRYEVFAGGGVLLLLGIALLPARAPAMISGLALVAAILLYDRWHKGQRFAPLVMGACRGLLYVVAATAAGAMTPVAWSGALVMTAYVSGLTVVARAAGTNARWLVPVLIAGISILDALFIAAVARAPVLALVAALGFPVTLLLQRVIRGD